MTDFPWKRLHIDFVGPLSGSYYFIGEFFKMARNFEELTSDVDCISKFLK